MPTPESIAYTQHHGSCPVCKNVTLMESAESEQGLCPIGKDLRWKAILALIRLAAQRAFPDTDEHVN